MVMNEDIQNKINEQAKKSQNEMLWGKPANDILNGRDNSVSAKPIRAIWEMVQNARDVSANESNIVFTRKNGTFEFKHDGIPFTNDTLNALILQTSAKSRNDGDQVGQYGTGFLTTHKFGRKFDLSGSIKLVDDEDIYYNFPRLTIDRTPNTREEMVTNLETQSKEKDSWREDLTYRSNSPVKWTVFKYYQPNEIEGKNVEEAFQQAPELIPYVLCLNEKVKSITLIDEITERTISFVRGANQQVGETEYATLYETPITITDSNLVEPYTNIIQFLNSKQTLTTKKGVTKPMVSVILPIRDKQVYQPSVNIARLFIYLPLVGSEQWGCNFILHSPLFTCSTDDRSSLRLIVDGQTDEDPAKGNQNYIQEATNIIFDFIQQHIAEWQNVHYLAPIYFDATNANKALSDYYRELKNLWLEKMRNLDIVYVQSESTSIRRKPSEIFVLDAKLANDIKAKEILLMPIYNVLSKMYKDAVPIPNHLTYWSEVFTQWYENENNNQIININNIIEFIASNGMSVINEADLLVICQYLRDSEQLSLFDKNILPTEDGKMTNKTDGYKCGTMCNRLKSSIKVLLPNHTSTFVKDVFADLIELPLFDNQNIKDALSSCTETLRIGISAISDAAKNNTSIPTDGLLNEEQRNALMDYCRMVIPRDSTSFQANVLNLVSDYYVYNFDFSDEIDSDFFEWRSAIRTLLCNVLTEFTILPNEQKKEKTEWIKEIIRWIFDYSDFNGMLQNYCIYLSQSGYYRYCKDLKKDAGIPSAMKDIFDTIKRVEIRKDLFDTEFGKIALTDATWDVVHCGKEIMDEIQKSGKYINDIDSYEYKNLIIDIIKNIEDTKEGKKWKDAFETIYNDTPSLLAKLVLNNENREPMIEIMKVKDITRLNKAAEIIKDENMLSIWEMGKAAWIEIQNQKYDFDKKMELGKYVEDCLRMELKDELSGFELDVNVDDNQGGQDIIVSINNNPVYYLEVKSRWKTADSVMMSALQLDQSVDKKDCYALMAVDMVGFNAENVKEHIYPDSMEEFVNRIRVVAEIGYLNEEIIPTKRNLYEQVHIGGDYKAVVPQNLINHKHISYNEFVNNVLKPKIVEAINKLK